MKRRRGRAFHSAQLFDELQRVQQREQMFTLVREGLQLGIARRLLHCKRAPPGCMTTEQGGYTVLIILEDPSFEQWLRSCRSALVEVYQQADAVRLMAGIRRPILGALFTGVREMTFTSIPRTKPIIVNKEPQRYCAPDSGFIASIASKYKP